MSLIDARSARRYAIAAYYADLLQPGGTSMLECDEGRPGVPRHFAREAGRFIVQRVVGDGQHELGEGWTMVVGGERLQVEGPGVYTVGVGGGVAVVIEAGGVRVRMLRGYP
jgi:hypothetical protein